MIKRIHLLTILFFLIQSAHAIAATSPSDELCLYVATLAQQSQAIDQDWSKSSSDNAEAKAEEFMKEASFTSEHWNEIIAAVADRKTWEQFQQGYRETLGNFVRSSYLGTYATHWCGFGVADAQTGEVHFPKQFDPTDHPYYSKMRESSSR